MQRETLIGIGSGILLILYIQFAGMLVNLITG